MPVQRETLVLREQPEPRAQQERQGRRERLVPPEEQEILVFLEQLVQQVRLEIQV